MTCEQPPELESQSQLKLNLDKFSYEQFKFNLMPSLRKEWRFQAYNPSVGFLTDWSEAVSFVGCASWTKKLMLEMEDKLRPHLVRAFGHAFRGDEVGAVGRDIVEGALKKKHLPTRQAAVEVLERWLDDDEHGTWLDILNSHIDFESDRQLKSQCAELVSARMDEEFEDMLDDEPDPPEFEEYLEVGRGLANRARALLETRALPGFLEKMADVDQRLTLALLESVTIGKLVAESGQHGFLLSRVGHGWQVRCWRLDGESSFSIEPTASDDRWLIFTRF